MANDTTPPMGGAEPVKTGTTTNAPNPTATAPVAIEDNEAGEPTKGAGAGASGRGEVDADVTFSPDPAFDRSSAMADAGNSSATGAGKAAGAGQTSGKTQSGGDASQDSEEKQSTFTMLKSEAGKLGQDASTQARGLADQGKERATGALDEVAQMLEDAAQQIDERLGEQFGGYARSAAGYVSDLAEQIRGKETDDLLDDARDFVSARPAVAVGAAVALGFIVARLARSGFEAATDQRAS